MSCSTVAFTFQYGAIGIYPVFKISLLKFVNLHSSMVRLEYNSDDFVGVWVYEFTFQYGAIGIKGTGLTLLVVFYLHSSMVRLECVLA